MSASNYHWCSIMSHNNRFQLPLMQHHVPQQQIPITVHATSCPTTTDSNYRWCSIMPHNNRFQLLLMQHHAPQQQIPITVDAASCPTTRFQLPLMQHHVPQQQIPITVDAASCPTTIDSNYRWCSIMSHNNRFQLPLMQHMSHNNRFQLPLMQHHVPQQEIPITVDAASCPTTTDSNYCWCSIMSHNKIPIHADAASCPTIRFQLPLKQHHVPQQQIPLGKLQSNAHCN